MAALIPPEAWETASPTREWCQACGAWRACRSPFMAPTIPDAWNGLLCVGERPGQEEDRVGRPFVGPAGRLLRQALREGGHDPDRTAYTNAVRCAAPRDRTPTMHEVRCCRPLLMGLVMAVRPKAIVLLGDTALRAWLDSGTVAPLKHVRGRPVGDAPWETKKPTGKGRS